MTRSSTRNLPTSSGSVREARYTGQSSSPEPGGRLCFTGHIESAHRCADIDRLWVTGRRFALVQNWLHETPPPPGPVRREHSRLRWGNPKGSRRPARLRRRLRRHRIGSYRAARPPRCTPPTLVRPRHADGKQPHTGIRVLPGDIGKPKVDVSAPHGPDRS